MDSYIIRIYRREKEDTGMVGTAERVGDDEKKSFRSVDELWQILSEPLPAMASVKHRKEGRGSVR